MVLEWDEALSIGHGSLDDDHKELIDNLNRLVQAVDSFFKDGGQEETSILKIADEIFNRFRDHSRHEEGVMREFQYQNTDRHASHHEFFIDALRTLLIEDPSLDAIRINLPFIQSAVVDHIERDDRDFGGYLKAIGCFGTV